MLELRVGKVWCQIYQIAYLGQGENSGVRATAIWQNFWDKKYIQTLDEYW